jgi:hypothetical protein
MPPSDGRPKSLANWRPNTMKGLFAGVRHCGARRCDATGNLRLAMWLVACSRLRRECNKYPFIREKREEYPEPTSRRWNKLLLGTIAPNTWLVNYANTAKGTYDRPGQACKKPLQESPLSVMPLRQYPRRIANRSDRSLWMRRVPGRNRHLLDRTPDVAHSPITDLHTPPWTWTVVA